MSPLEMNRVLAPHTTYDDGTPHFDAETGLMRCASYVTDLNALAELDQINVRLQDEDALWSTRRAGP